MSALGFALAEGVVDLHEVEGLGAQHALELVVALAV
jgi:hypothetical protein